MLFRGEFKLRLGWWGIRLEQTWEQECGWRDAFRHINAAASSAEQQKSRTGRKPQNFPI